MRKVQFVLAYYTLIMSLLLFVWSIFMAPKPLGFFIALAVIPIGIYFWTIILGRAKIKAVEFPKEAKSEEQMAKLSLVILLTLFISMASISVYYLISVQLLGIKADPSSKISSELSLLSQEIERTNEKNEDALEKMQSDIEEIKNELLYSEPRGSTTRDSLEILGSRDSGSVGMITIKNRDYRTVNIYREKSSGSEVVGKAEYGRMYTYIDKDPEWYQIILVDSKNNQTGSGGVKEGYISRQFVEEVDY